MKLSDLKELAGDDWSTVWRKLGITPKRKGQLLIGQLYIDDKAVQPVYCQLGYSNRPDVVRALCSVFGLSVESAVDFVSCHKDLTHIVAAVEERYVLYGDELDEELEQ